MSASWIPFVTQEIYIALCSVWKTNVKTGLTVQAINVLHTNIYNVAKVIQVSALLIAGEKSKVFLFVNGTFINAPRFHF